MKNLVFLLFLMILFAACESKVKQNNSDDNIYKPEIAFSIDEKDLIPEGITYDPQTKQFFLSSLYKKKIIAVAQEGNHRDFIHSRQDGMMGSLGLKVDLQRRRLWALSYDTIKSFVHIYNIDSGDLIKKYSPSSDIRHTFNDLILTKDGSAYITDPEGNSIYFVPSQLNELQLFVKSDSLLQLANGISISPDNSILYVASHTKGIVLIDIENKSIQPIENWLQADTRGVDGMMFYNNSLVCIRSGDPDKSKHHITRYWLSKNGKEIIKAEIIDHKNKMFDEPTTGVIVDGYLYCIAVTSLGIFSENKMEQTELLKNPVVWKYNLDW